MKAVGFSKRPSDVMCTGECGDLREGSGRSLLIAGLVFSMFSQSSVIPHGVRLIPSYATSQHGVRGISPLSDRDTMAGESNSLRLRVSWEIGVFFISIICTFGLEGS